MGQNGPFNYGNTSLASGSMARARLAIAIGAMALAIVGCAWNTRWAGLTQPQAIGAAKEEAIQSSYGGDARLFNLNLWSVEARPTTVSGQRVWLVKFYDAQVMKASCAYAWERGAVRTRHVRCVATELGAGQPQ
jgi:hypothetical protein